MKANPTIILLTGPKGAGKSYLAARIEQEHNIPFVRVEPIWMRLATEGRLSGCAFDEEGQLRVIAEVKRQLGHSPWVVLESTGTAPWFRAFLDRLRTLGEVFLIKVSAPSSQCLERVQTRDRSQHLAVSDARVAEINALAEHVELPWSMVVENRTEIDASHFLRQLAAHLGGQTVRQRPG